MAISAGAGERLERSCAIIPKTPKIGGSLKYEALTRHSTRSF
jgi:hypothetical protein